MHGYDRSLRPDRPLSFPDDAEQCKAPRRDRNRRRRTMVTVVLYMVRFPIDLVSHLASPCLTSKLSYRAFFLPPSLPYLSFSLPLVLALRARFCFFSRVRLHREPLRCVPRAREYVCIYRSHVCVSESANVCAPLSFLRATHTWCVKSCWWRWRWQLSAC